MGRHRDPVTAAIHRSPATRAGGSPNTSEVSAAHSSRPWKAAGLPVIRWPVRSLTGHGKSRHHPWNRRVHCLPRKGTRGEARRSRCASSQRQPCILPSRQRASGYLVCLPSVRPRIGRQMAVDWPGLSEPARHPPTFSGVVLGMPPKIRDLIARMERAGFVNHGGRGSHRNFTHPRVRKPVTISGGAGEDAKPYQLRAVSHAIEESQS